MSEDNMIKMAQEHIAQEIQRLKNNAAEQGYLFIFESGLTQIQKYAAAVGKTLPELGYSDQAIETIKTQTLIGHISSEIENAKYHSEKGWPEEVMKDLNEALRCSKLLGKTLSELGHSEEEINAIKKDTLINLFNGYTNNAVRSILRGASEIEEFLLVDEKDWAQERAESMRTTSPKLVGLVEIIGDIQKEALNTCVYATVNNAERERMPYYFEKKLKAAQKYANRLNSRVAAIVGPKKTQELRAMALDRAINVDTILEYNPSTDIPPPSATRRLTQWAKGKVIGIFGMNKSEQKQISAVQPGGQG